jgi:hypothetical protein
MKMAKEKLKRYKSPGSDQIPAVLTHAEGRTVHSEIHKVTDSIRNNDELHENLQCGFVHNTSPADLIPLCAEHPCVFCFIHING